MRIVSGRGRKTIRLRSSSPASSASRRRARSTSASGGCAPRRPWSPPVFGAGRGSCFVGSGRRARAGVSSGLRFAGANPAGAGRLCGLLAGVGLLAPPWQAPVYPPPRRRLAAASASARGFRLGADFPRQAVGSIQEKTRPATQCKIVRARAQAREDYRYTGACGQCWVKASMLRKQCAGATACFRGLRYEAERDHLYSLIASARTVQ